MRATRRRMGTRRRVIERLAVVVRTADLRACQVVFASDVPGKSQLPWSTPNIHLVFLFFSRTTLFYLCIYLTAILFFHRFL